jgi:putative transposase
MDHDSDLPHRRSIRLPGYDYAQAGAYFVTILAYRKYRLFGDVNFGIVKLTPLGNIADDCWLEIPQHFPNVEPATHIVMPNHIHGIVVIRGTQQRSGVARTERYGKPVAGSLSTIVRSYKSAVSKRARELLKRPALLIWQRGYFEHIIRDENDFLKTCKYIRENPRRREFDSENPFGIPAEEWNF